MQAQTRPVDTTGVAHDRVYRALRVQIMHGEIEPGTALTLRGIGRQFDVSMTPAREAVRHHRPQRCRQKYAAARSRGNLRPDHGAGFDRGRGRLAV